MLEASLNRGTRVTILGLKNTEANKNRVFAHQNHLHGLFLNSKIPFLFFFSPADSLGRANPVRLLWKEHWVVNRGSFVKYCNKLHKRETHKSQFASVAERIYWRVSTSICTVI